MEYSRAGSGPGAEDAAREASGLRQSVAELEGRCEALSLELGRVYGALGTDLDDCERSGVVSHVRRTLRLLAGLRDEIGRLP